MIRWLPTILLVLLGIGAFFTWRDCRSTGAAEVRGMATKGVTVITIPVINPLPSGPQFDPFPHGPPPFHPPPYRPPLRSQ